MVERASLGRRGIQFHNFSTLPFGFGRKTLSEQTFSGSEFDPPSLNSQFEDATLMGIIGMEYQFHGSFLHW
jgi:hypothetical protein